MGAKFKSVKQKDKFDGFLNIIFSHFRYHLRLFRDLNDRADEFIKNPILENLQEI